VCVDVSKGSRLRVERFIFKECRHLQRGWGLGIKGPGSCGWL